MAGLTRHYRGRGLFAETNTGTITGGSANSGYDCCTHLARIAALQELQQGEGAGVFAYLLVAWIRDQQKTTPEPIAVATQKVRAS